jgi:hypothetical protein
MKQFQCQPTTKIFEYHLSGMPVLATATCENAKVIRKEDGVLISDDPLGVSQGLMTIYRNLSGYDSNVIRRLSAGYTWERVISDHLAPFLTSFPESPSSSFGNPSLPECSRSASHASTGLRLHGRGWKRSIERVEYR